MRAFILEMHFCLMIGAMLSVGDEFLWWVDGLSASQQHQRNILTKASVAARGVLLISPFNLARL
jgi:hypothetical protein